MCADSPIPWGDAQLSARNHTLASLTSPTTAQEIIAADATYELVTNADGRTGWCEKTGGPMKSIRGIFAHAECEQQCTDDTSCTAYSYSEDADSESGEGCTAYCWHEKCRVYTDADVVFTSGHINEGSSGVHCYQKTSGGSGSGSATQVAIALPSQPEDGADFWKELWQVNTLQRIRLGLATSMRRKTKLPADLIDLPALFEGFSFEEAAEAVRADFPTEWPTKLAQQFLSNGTELDSAVISTRSPKDFVNTQVMLARVIGWAVSTVSPPAFALKWDQGRPRPEEAAAAVRNGLFDTLPEDKRPPEKLKYYINAVYSGAPEDQTQVSWTAYKNGSPRHPSWPAMHSAASSASLYLAVVLNLTSDQLKEARKLDYAVAYFRSLAGVHYPTDNLAGLTLGQNVVAKELPDMLEEFYPGATAGATKAAAEEKIKKLLEAHSWDTYEPRAACPSIHPTDCDADGELYKWDSTADGYLSDTGKEAIDAEPSESDN
jgi:membrane-associated phospholipid phosphatase